MSDTKLFVKRQLEAQYKAELAKTENKNLQQDVSGLRQFKRVIFTTSRPDKKPIPVMKPQPFTRRGSDIRARC